MVLDQRPFIRKALARCKRIRKDLAERQAILAGFEQVDRPAFQQWMAQHFGAELSRIRECEAEASRLGSWISMMRSAVMYENVPMDEVYEYTRRHREDPDFWDPRYDRDPKAAETDADSDYPGDDDLEGSDEPWMAAAREVWATVRGDLWEKIKQFAALDGRDPAVILADVRADWFQAFQERHSGGRKTRRDDAEDASEGGFGGRKPNREERRRHGPDSFRDGHRDGRPEAKAGERPTFIGDLKALYRRLARRLHPDVRSAVMVDGDTRWQKLQAAYESQDYEQLRALEAICDADETGLSVSLDLAQLNTWADYHQELLKPLQAAMREAKRDPAWEFTKLPPEALTVKKRELQRAYTGEVELMEAVVAELEAELAFFRQAKERAEAAAEREARRRQAAAEKREARKNRPAKAAAKVATDPGPKKGKGTAETEIDPLQTGFDF